MSHRYEELLSEFRKNLTGLKFEYTTIVEDEPKKIRECVSIRDLTSLDLKKWVQHQTKIHDKLMSQAMQLSVEMKKESLIDVGEWLDKEDF